MKEKKTGANDGEAYYLTLEERYKGLLELRGIEVIKESGMFSDDEINTANEYIADYIRLVMYKDIDIFHEFKKFLTAYVVANMAFNKIAELRDGNRKLYEKQRTQYERIIKALEKALDVREGVIRRQSEVIEDYTADTLRAMASFIDDKYKN